jgi:hypothetical protein
MRPIGFSTGALALGDFRRALTLLREHRVEIVELSALRMEELEPLVSAIPNLDLKGFTFISMHAPSRFDRQSEHRVLDLLRRRELKGFPVVVHPDVIFTPALWDQLGDRLLIENMDKRKPVGRTVRELRHLLDLLPDARFCFDIGHARQVDPTMTEAALLLQTFRERLAEVHISEVNTASRHDPISRNATLAFQTVARYIPPEIPIILESLIDKGQSGLDIEIRRAREALSVDCFVEAD